VNRFSRVVIFLLLVSCASTTGPSDVLISVPGSVAGASRVGAFITFSLPVQITLQPSDTLFLQQCRNGPMYSIESRKRSAWRPEMVIVCDERNISSVTYVGPRKLQYVEQVSVKVGSDNAFRIFLGGTARVDSQSVQLASPIFKLRGF
jgi:hypothetical protein